MFFLLFLSSINIVIWSIIFLFLLYLAKKFVVDINICVKKFL